jgi:hypothetical protein
VNHGTAECISFGGLRTDVAVGRAILRLLKSLGVDAANIVGQARSITLAGLFSSARFSARWVTDRMLEKELSTRAQVNAQTSAKCAGRLDGPLCPSHPIPGYDVWLSTGVGGSEPPASLGGQHEIAESESYGRGR